MRGRRDQLPAESRPRRCPLQHRRHDLAGRVTTLWYPAQLADTTRGKPTYAYNGTTGLLSEVRGLQMEQFTMTYNGRNEMTQMAMPGSIQEFNVFDADGLLAKHGIRNLTSGTDRFPASLIDSTDIWTNLRGGVDSAFNRAGTLDRRRVRYEGLGQVRVDTMTATGSNVYGFVSATVIEGFNHDPLGNLLSSIEYFSQTGREQASVKTSWAWNGSMSHFDTLAGRLDSVVKINADQRQRFHYDSAGNNWLTRLDANPGGGPPTKYDDRVSYFNTLDQLVGAERRIAGPPDGDVWN